MRIALVVTGNLPQVARVRPTARPRRNRCILILALANLRHIESEEVHVNEEEEGEATGGSSNLVDLVNDSDADGA